MIMKRELEPTDAEIEAIVAEAIAAEASIATSEAQPPSSAIVWWRAQMRARQEAAQLVERPLTIVHALAISCGIGVLAALVGTTIAGVKGSLAWAAGLFQSADDRSAKEPCAAGHHDPAAMPELCHRPLLNPASARSCSSMSCTSSRKRVSGRQPRRSAASASAFIG